MNNARPRRLGDLFVMRKEDRMAVCALHTHDLGWECRLFSGDDLIATHVCRSDAEIETFVDTVAQGAGGEGMEQREVNTAGQLRTEFDTSFEVLDGHLRGLTDYIEAFLPKLAEDERVIPLFTESAVVLLQAWYEHFLKSVVSYAVRLQEAAARDYFQNLGRADATTCGVLHLLAMARGRIKYEKRGAAIQDVFVSLLGFPLWPDEESRDVFIDFNLVRQIVVHHPSGVVGDDYWEQFSNQSLLRENRYGELVVRRLFHARVLIFIHEFVVKLNEQGVYLRSEMLRRPQWADEATPSGGSDAEA